MVLVSEFPSTPSGQSEIIGVGRLSKLHGRDEAEFAVLIRDDFQKQGLGSELLTRLLAVARNERLERVIAIMSAENSGMRKMAARAGFHLSESSEDHLVTAVVDVSATQTGVI
jgi:acetyltransferase